MTITFGDGTEDKKIKITKEAIHKVFGYPNGTQMSAPRPTSSPSSMKELMSDLGFKSTKFTLKQLYKELEKLVEIDDKESNRKSVKIFFLIFSTTLSAGQAPLSSPDKL